MSGVQVHDQVLDWVRRAIGDPEATVDSVRLFSVSSTTLHAIDLTDRHGTVHELALRTFHREQRLSDDPWYVPANEATVLRLLGPSDVPAPELVAADLDQQYCTAPTLLTTRVPGSTDDEPEDQTRFLTQLAEALVTIHQVDASAATGLARYSPYYDPAIDGERTVPDWSVEPELWERAFKLISEPPPDSNTGFIHRDFHPGQILWRADRLTGVVDWTTGCWGPRAIDLARMRINLAEDYGLDYAEQFLAIHRELAGGDLHHPYWDLVDLADLILDRDAPETDEDMQDWDELEDWARQAIAEL